MLSLLLAFGTYAWALLKSYFEHPVIAALNLLPVVLLLLVFYGLLGRPWAAFLADAVLVGGFSLANYYLLRCRDDPLMFEDIKYLRRRGPSPRTPTTTCPRTRGSGLVWPASSSGRCF